MTFVPGDVVLFHDTTVGIIVEGPRATRDDDSVWGRWWGLRDKGKWTAPLYALETSLQLVGHLNIPDLTDAEL